MKKRLAAVLSAMLLCTLFVGCAGKEAAPIAPQAVFSHDSLGFYYKDGELWGVDTDSGISRQLTQHYNEWNNTNNVQLADDSSRVFFFDFTDDTQSTPVLCYCDMTENGKPFKIAEGEITYHISRDGKTAVYMLAGDDKLYCVDVDHGKTVTYDDAVFFGFTQKDDHLWYTSTTSKRYIVQNGKAEEVSDEEFSGVYGGSRKNRYEYNGAVDLMPDGLYVDGVKIDELPSMETIQTLPDCLLYFTGTNDGTAQQPDDIPFEAKLYVKGSAAPVVILSTLGPYFSTVQLTSDGGVLYLENYDEVADTGDLMCYRDGKRLPIDVGVSFPASFTEYETR